MTDLLLLATLAVVALIGWQANRAREIARRAGRLACERESVQFLDDTVVQRRWWIARNAHGYLELRRFYEFEFAVGGVDRHRGHVVLHGWRVNEVRLDPISRPTSNTLVS